MNSTIIIQGLIFALVTFAVYLTSRVINKDDLTTEGSFGVGGALSAVLLHYNWPSALTMILCLCAGALAGLTTGLLYTRLKMNHLMAGLSTTTACFSICLALAGANKNISANATIFKPYAGFGVAGVELTIIATIVLLVLGGLVLLLKSELGLILRATGDNPQMLLTLGKSTKNYYLFGFILANAITALAGSLSVQWSGFFSITGNIGTLVTGLASLMLAELLVKNLGVALILAAIVYQGILALTLTAGIPPVWINLVKAIIVVMLVIVSRLISTKTSKVRHA